MPWEETTKGKEELRVCGSLKSNIVVLCKNSTWVMALPFDILRLQESLHLEATQGFTNLRGKSYFFAEFLALSFSQELPSHWKPQDKQYAQELADRFKHYETSPLPTRQQLVAATRHFLYEMRRLELSAPMASSPRPPKTKPLGAAKTALTLTTSLHQLESIGATKAQRLERLGLKTIGDVLHFYPRDHIDYARQLPIYQLEEHQTATVIGEIQQFHCFTSPKNPQLTIMEVRIRDRTGQLKLQRFWMGTRYSQRGWQEQQRKLYPIGASVAASGIVKKGKQGLTLEDFTVEILAHRGDPITSDTIGRLVPVYPLTEGISPAMIRKLVIDCLPVAQKISDPLPPKLLQKYGLVSLGTALTQIHYPDTPEKLTAAIQRLMFNKYFFRRLVALRRRQQQHSAVFIASGDLISRFESLLPFTLTSAQRRVIAEIQTDLHRPNPMNRLVQGDVGSGKTIVAVYGLLMAIESGYQTAFMAPTEVLVAQHYSKIVHWFAQLGLPVELLTGSTRTAPRRKILQQLATGELPLVIGTHALIQDPVQFQRLGMVVIDEQHRFGRDQRSRLLRKGGDPHVLIMTATPIPRTLYLTNSEIEVSVIDELPPGRQPIQTTLIRPGQRKRAYELIRREVTQGRQCYVVLPLVEESEKLEDVRAATQEWERLQRMIFPHFRVGLLHGQMNTAEKDQAIHLFRNHQTDILVATTVIEVGVDVPNASVMLIEHADRFGLAQLHQLRGRVGRGAAQSYCLLSSDSRSETSQERLEVLVSSQDGFYIAEQDYALRGKGKDEGKEQSGHSGFVIDDRMTDKQEREFVYTAAREAAALVLNRDPTLTSFPLLLEAFEYHYDRLQGGAIFT